MEELLRRYRLVQSHLAGVQRVVAGALEGGDAALRASLLSDASAPACGGGAASSSAAAAGRCGGGGGEGAPLLVQQTEELARQHGLMESKLARIQREIVGALQGENRALHLPCISPASHLNLT